MTHRAMTPAPTADYLRAHHAMHAPSSDTHAALLDAGLTIEQRSDGRHWIISGRGLRLHHWPTSGRWMAYGRVWRSSAGAVVRALDAGRIRMPDDARQARCRRCEAEIWWRRSDRGRWMPLDADGDSHTARCRP